MARLIGILGGTFDPVHNGHLQPAAELMQAVGLEQVRFIPNRVPPHREPPWLDSDTRRRLVDMAIAPYAGFVLDDRELRRQGSSFMVDTLDELHAELPDATLCLIMGADAFAHFTQWHRWQTILELCHLIVMTRPGADLADASDQQPELAARMTRDPQALGNSHHGQILLQSVTPVAVSATLVRERLGRGESIADLVPESIREQLETQYAI